MFMFGLVAVFGERAPVAGFLAQTVIFLLMMLLSVWLGGRLLDRRRFADFGMGLDHAWWVDFGVGLILGGLMMALIFGVEWSAGWIGLAGTFRTAPSLRAPFGLVILAPLLSYICVGIREEVPRGYVLRNLAEGLNVPRIGARRAIMLAWLLSSAGFGLLHAMNPHATIMSTVNIMMAGMLLGLPYIVTGRLGLSIGLHITWNFFQGNVFGFPVSGGGIGMATLIATVEQGPDLWTGGAFGPEAGLVGVAAMVLACLLVLVWVRYSDRQATLHLPLARYTPRSSTRTPSIKRRAPAHAQL
jgi:membrane protease YdiL (CAAX protease family)